MGKTLYLFPGLGADESIFRNLKLPGYEIVHIKWIKPLNGENVADYAARLTYQIKDDTEAVLIGLSFGGMVAQEIAKLIDPTMTIIVSSIKTVKEKPIQMDIAKKLRPHKLIPSILAIEFDFWYPWTFGKTTAFEKSYIKRMARGIHPDFTDWATDAAINWENTVTVPNLLHIHGTKDNLFPPCYIKNARMIKGGTHFMVYNRADEVAEIILNELAAKGQQKLRIA